METFCTSESLAVEFARITDMLPRGSKILIYDEISKCAMTADRMREPLLTHLYGVARISIFSESLVSHWLITVIVKMEEPCCKMNSRSRHSTNVCDSPPVEQFMYGKANAKLAWGSFFAINSHANPLHDMDFCKRCEASYAVRKRKLAENSS